MLARRLPSGAPAPTQPTAAGSRMLYKPNPAETRLVLSLPSPFVCWVKESWPAKHRYHSPRPPSHRVEARRPPRPLFQSRQLQTTRTWFAPRAAGGQSPTDCRRRLDITRGKAKVHPHGGLRRRPTMRHRSFPGLPRRTGVPALNTPKPQRSNTGKAFHSTPRAARTLASDTPAPCGRLRFDIFVTRE